MIITLTTDFGLSDPFAGIMKGVILSIAPEVQIVDVSHGVASYNVAEAAFLVNSSFRYFPEGTIHVVVVDSGVGSSRRPIAAFAQNHYFVAPDNGVLSYVLHTESPAPPASVHHITNQRLFRNPVSHTFHGRDIFAPTAAHLARGMRLGSVGESITDFDQKPLPRPRSNGPNRLIASVLHIDRFGNIVTSLRRNDLLPPFRIRIAGKEVSDLRRTFSDAAPGELVAVEGSTGYIEIAFNQGSAAGRLQITTGAEMEVETGPVNHLEF
jgi:S-adenosyl-L-methionine hydrolase (adenosine-forming)